MTRKLPHDQIETKSTNGRVLCTNFSFIWGLKSHFVWAKVICSRNEKIEHGQTKRHTCRASRSPQRSNGARATLLGSSTAWRCPSARYPILGPSQSSSYRRETRHSSGPTRMVKHTRAQTEQFIRKKGSTVKTLLRNRTRQKKM